MGRHRSEPIGAARLALIGVAGLVVLTLIVVGVVALIGALDSGETPRPGPSSAAPTAPAATPTPARTPTIAVTCQAARCPVFIRVSGGDVLVDRDLTQGERVQFFDQRLDVVLDDAGIVAVLVNGEPRAQGKPGERQTFTVTRDPGLGA